MQHRVVRQMDRSDRPAVGPIDSPAGAAQMVNHDATMGTDHDV